MCVCVGGFVWLHYFLSFSCTSEFTYCKVFDTTRHLLRDSARVWSILLDPKTVREKKSNQATDKQSDLRPVVPLELISQLLSMDMPKWITVSPDVLVLSFSACKFLYIAERVGNQEP